MEIRGQELVKLLLEAYMELEKSDVRIRSIQPSNTFVSKNYDKVTFADISASCQRNTTASREVGVHEPYSSIGFYYFSTIASSSPFWDRWSIGIMILEIIVGTDLLLEQTTYGELEKFLLNCKDYFDVDTFEFLNCMLFSVSEVPFPPGQFISEHLEKKPHLVAENIRAMDTAIKENKTFQAIGESFSKRLPSKRDELSEKFYFEDMDLNRA